MPAKSGAFHSLGYLVSVIVSGLLIEYILVYVPSFRQLSTVVGSLLALYLAVPVRDEVAGMMVITMVLLGFWGAGYHIYRY